MNATLQQLPALREWAATCDAIARGEQGVLIRKGGIAEGPEGFEVEALKFALLPTVFHEKHGQPSPDEIVVSVICEIVKSIEVPSDADLSSLAAFHRYDPVQLATRLAYKPEKPLALIAIRAAKLETPAAFSADAIRPICRSWQSLPLDLSTSSTRSITTLFESTALTSALRALEKSYEK